MKKYAVSAWYALRPEIPDGKNRRSPLDVYIASDVDARIAELERERDQAIADLRVARAAYAALTSSSL